MSELPEPVGRRQEVGIGGGEIPELRLDGPRMWGRGLTGLGRGRVTDSDGREHCPRCDAIDPLTPEGHCTHRWHRMYAPVRMEQFWVARTALAVATLALLLAVALALVVMA